MAEALVKVFMPAALISVAAGRTPGDYPWKSDAFAALSQSHVFTYPQVRGATKFSCGLTRRSTQRLSQGEVIL